MVGCRISSGLGAWAQQSAASRMAQSGSVIWRFIAVQQLVYIQAEPRYCSVQEITVQQISCGAGHRFSWPAEFEHGAQTTNNDRLRHADSRAGMCLYRVWDSKIARIVSRRRARSG